MNKQFITTDAINGAGPIFLVDAIEVLHCSFVLILLESCVVLIRIVEVLGINLTLEYTASDVTVRYASLF